MYYEWLHRGCGDIAGARCEYYGLRELRLSFFSPLIFIVPGWMGLRCYSHISPLDESPSLVVTRHVALVMLGGSHGCLDALFSHLVSNKPTNHHLFHSGQEHGRWETSRTQDIVLPRTACGLTHTYVPLFLLLLLAIHVADNCCITFRYNSRDVGTFPNQTLKDKSGLRLFNPTRVGRNIIMS